MLSTSVLIAYFVISIACTLVLPIWMLHLGTKWVGAAAPSIWKAIGASFLGSLGSAVLMVVIWAIPLDDERSTVIVISVVQSVIAIVVQCAVIGLIYRINLWRAFKVWLLTLIPVGGFAALAFLVIRPYVIEPYMIPTNSMAPTIIGQHWKGTCPRCGQPLLIALPKNSTAFEISRR